MLEEVCFLSMSKKLDGKQLAREIERRLHSEIEVGSKIVGRAPGLAVIRVGNDPASQVYVANKEKACLRIGVKSFGSHLPENSSIEDVQKKIQELNNNNHVDGILLQLPLPNGLNEALILKCIDPNKDVDGLHTLNLGKLLKGEPGLRSCTPAGVMALLARNQIPIKGKRAVVIGRSILVGKPMALMLQHANATVSVAHSQTNELASLTRQAELLIVAAGKPQMIGKEHVRENAVVVDVGIHRVPVDPLLGNSSTYKLCGDVRANELDDIASAITPVPGGVGPMTVSMLLVNTVTSWQQHCGLSITLGDFLP